MSPRLDRLATFVCVLFLSATSYAFQISRVFHVKSFVNTKNSNRNSVLKSTAGPEPPLVTETSDPFEELRQKLRGTCVYFIGMMGSGNNYFSNVILHVYRNIYIYIYQLGKTTTGKIFAEKLGYRFLDTDEIAEFMVSSFCTQNAKLAW